MIKIANKRAGQRGRRVALLLVMLLLVGLSSGCEMPSKEQETDMYTFVGEMVDSTAKAMEDRDTKLARDVWSALTEYAVMAEDEGHTALKDAICDVACTYGSLVDYCDAGAPEDLADFKDSFQRASEALSKMIGAEGYDTATLDERIALICGS